MINSQSLLYQNQVNEVLKGAGESILKWFDDKSITLGENESLRIRAAIMNIKGKKSWFDPTNEGIKSVK